VNAPVADAATKSPTTPRADHAVRARAYWAANLDPQNLERRGAGWRGLDLDEEISMAGTPEIEAARLWLEGVAPERGVVLDLGAGLGAVSFHLARHGWDVLCLDASPARLRALRRRAAQAGLKGRVHAVAGLAEALPLADAGLPAVVTKSVLIHTDLEAALAELARVLRSGGRAALIEPQARHPIAWLYRRTLAPRAWRAITRYFDESAQGRCLKAIGSGRVEPFYLLAFVAFAFQYAWPRPGAFRRLLSPLARFDAWLLRRWPRLKRWAWFGVILAERA